MAEQESLLQSSDPHLQLLLKQSVRYSFFQAMRQIETTYSSMPRVGYSSSPSQEPFRIQQPADLAFAPTAIDSVSENLDGKISIEQRFFGLLGPSGPLPLHLTEIVRNRSRHANDSALQSFLDIFHHRMASLFYRAWSSARPAVQSSASHASARRPARSPAAQCKLPLRTTFRATPAQAYRAAERITLRQDSTPPYLAGFHCA